MSPADQPAPTPYLHLVYRDERGREVYEDKLRSSPRALDGEELARAIRAAHELVAFLENLATARRQETL